MKYPLCINRKSLGVQIISLPWHSGLACVGYCLDPGSIPPSNHLLIFLLIYSLFKNVKSHVSNI